MCESGSRDRQRHELLVRLNAAKTQAERNRLGQFATPPELAGSIVNHALSLLPKRSAIRFLEPGFGTGPFFSALIESVSQERIEAAKGYEIDRHYGENAQLFWKDWKKLSLSLSDFTKAEPPESEDAKYNLVVCNPPYVRHHHLALEQKRELQSLVFRRLGFEMNGLSGLYAYFMILSLKWMTEGGIGAWLVPSEFMDVNYGKMVKRFLLEKVTLERIHRFDPDEIQFGDALVSSSVVIFRNRKPSSKTKIEFSFGGSLSNPKIQKRIDPVDLHFDRKWSRLMIDKPNRVEKRGTLSDLFSIKRGLATGCNNFFVLSKEQIDSYSLPQNFFVPILPSPRYLLADEIQTDRSGIPKIEKQLFLLTCNLKERKVKLDFPKLWDYFEKGRLKKIHERYLCRTRTPWYSQEKRSVAPFLLTYMGRSTKTKKSPFRFILNHSKAIAANVYLMIYPKPTLAAILKNNRENKKKVWKALNAIASGMIKGEGRVYGGGLHKIEPKELANVPSDTILEALSDNLDFDPQVQLDLFATQ